MSNPAKVDGLAHTRQGLQAALARIAELDVIVSNLEDDVQQLERANANWIGMVKHLTILLDQNGIDPTTEGIPHG